MCCDPNLVFDLGAHDGKDTAYYLSKGFKVMALEAHPEYARGLQSLGRATGLVRPVGKALAEAGTSKVKLYPSQRHGGETHSIHPHRVKDLDVAPIEVEAVALPWLFVNHGVPFYMKIDIEGSDVVAIRQLHEWQTQKNGDVPPYLSVELDAEHPEEALEMFSHLAYMGYETFRLVNQRLVPAGAYGPGFGWGMSGPFGPEVFAEDCGNSLPEVAGWWFSNTRPHKRDWFDLHCRHKGATPNG